MDVHGYRLVSWTVVVFVVVLFSSCGSVITDDDDDGGGAFVIDEGGGSNYRLPPFSNYRGDFVGTRSDSSDHIPCDGACTGDEACDNNVCVSICGDGFTKCGDTCTDISSDIENCGACGTTCLFPYAAAICRDAVCVMGGCEIGYADCNNDITDGCEVDIGIDANDCGVCENVCPVAGHATSMCADGICGFFCTGDSADCDNDPTNGCEARLTMDVLDCGVCGNICPIRTNATHTCWNGICRIMCVVPYHNCDDNEMNGCESNRLTDVNNCGTCGTRCGDGEECIDRECSPIETPFP